MNKIWKLVKWIKNRNISYKIYILTLIDDNNKKIIDKIEKTTLLIKKFFLKFSKIDFSDISNDYFYSNSTKFEKLKNHEIIYVIKDVSKKKISNIDEINNKTFISLLLILISLLKQLFKTCIRTRYCSIHFRESITMIFKKFKKKSYNIAKTYRSITLLNTLSKTLKFVLINRLTWTTETYELFPNLHLKGRKGISSKMMMHTLMEKIHATWKKKLTTTAFLLDVSDVFDNVFHRRLLHNLRKRKIENAMLKWIVNFINNRRIKFRLSNFESKWIYVNTGISQDFSFSLIFYLFYNPDLLTNLNNVQLNVTFLDYIDDIAVLIISETIEINIQKLESVHTKVLKWFDKHVSRFDYNKYQLIHFTKRNSRQKQKNQEFEFDLVFLERIIKASINCVYLKVIIDKQLKWNEHLNAMKKKIIDKLVVLRVMSKFIWRINLNDMRTIYQEIIFFLFLYCASAWYTFIKQWNYFKNKNFALKILKSIQKRVAHIINEVFSIIDDSVFDVKLYLILVHLMLKQILVSSMLRIVFNRAYKNIKKIRNRFKLKVNKLNFKEYEFSLLNSLRKLKIQYQNFYDVNFNRLKHRCVYVFFSWWIFLKIMIIAVTVVLRICLRSV